VAARALLAEAGYPAGFGFTLTCPNDRYVNGDKVCVAIAGMWARIGLDVKLELLPKVQYFPKAQRREVSAYLHGWGPGSEAIFTLKPVMHSPNEQSGAGVANYGNASNPRLDALIDRIETEMDSRIRQDTINEAIRIMQDEVHAIPLHLQMIPWVSRRNVEVVHRPSNILYPAWVRVN
jgi:peptide/nickel transport system substrate-binding protein